MSDIQTGPDWWQASDGKWYPPDQKPGNVPAAPAPIAADNVVPLGPRFGSWALNVVLGVVTLGIGWLIWALVLVLQGTGQTPGKKLLGQKVITNETGENTGFARMFWLRGVVAGIVVQIGFYLFVIPGILILLLPFFTKDKMTIYEKVSGTSVVYA